MRDRDMELRRLANALVSEAPEAPTFDAVTATPVRPLGHSRGPRRAAAFAVGVVVLVAIAIVIAVLAGPDDSQLRPAGPTGFMPCTQQDPGAFVGPNGQTFGPARSPHPEKGGSLTSADIAAMPDFIPVTCKTGDTIGGWIKKTDMLASPTPANPESAQEAPSDVDPVYSTDGVTVVGHMVAGIGFVALGEDPNPTPVGWRAIRVDAAGVSLAVPQDWKQQRPASTATAKALFTVSSASSGPSDAPLTPCDATIDSMPVSQTWITLYEYPTTSATANLTDPIEGANGQSPVAVVPRPSDFATTNEASDGSYGCNGDHGYKDQFFSDGGRTFVARTVYYGPVVTKAMADTSRQILNTLRVTRKP
jgi:hypothetical protein